MICREAIWMYPVLNWMTSNEEIGEEDEENNYYSLGGDNHDDLEESKE